DTVCGPRKSATCNGSRSSCPRAACTFSGSRMESPACTRSAVTRCERSASYAAITPKTPTCSFPSAAGQSVLLASTGRRALRSVGRIGRNDLSQVLRVHAGGKRGRTDQVREHHRDLAALGFVPWARVGPGRKLGRGGGGAGPPKDSTWTGDRCSAGFRPGLCPLWVKSGHRALVGLCPLYPQKRTFGHSLSSSGSLAMLTAIRRASSKVNCLASTASLSVE